MPLLKDIIRKTSFKGNYLGRGPRLAFQSHSQLPLVRQALLELSDAYFCRAEVGPRYTGLIYVSEQPRKTRKTVTGSQILVRRTRVSQDGPTVCILDSGITRTHQLLDLAVNLVDVHTYHPDCRSRPEREKMMLPQVVIEDARFIVGVANLLSLLALGSAAPNVENRRLAHFVRKLDVGSVGQMRLRDNVMLLLAGSGGPCHTQASTERDNVCALFPCLDRLSTSRRRDILRSGKLAQFGSRVQAHARSERPPPTSVWSLTI